MVRELPLLKLLTRSINATPPHLTNKCRNPGCTLHGLLQKVIELSPILLLLRLSVLFEIEFTLRRSRRRFLGIHASCTVLGGVTRETLLLGIALPVSSGECYFGHMLFIFL